MNLPMLPTANQLGSDVQAAFREFVEQLSVRVPKELVLVNPQLVPEEVFDLVVARNKGYYAFPPVGLLYIAAAAKEVLPKLTVRIVDLNYEMLRRSQEENFRFDFWRDHLREIIESCEAPHIGVTCMFGSTKPVFEEVSRWIRNTFPNHVLLAGGVQATYDCYELLEKDLCDILFRREGEGQIQSFLRCCLDTQCSDMPLGAAFRLRGRVYDLGETIRPGPIDLDIRPYYDLIDIRNYYKVGSLAAFSRLNGVDKPFATVLSNRGCRAHCTFCTVRDFNGPGVRGRAVQNVIDEIKFLVREKGIRQIDWLDDDLLWDPRRTVELFQGLAEQVPELEWICNNGLIAAAVSDDIMYWMYKSGLKAFKIGIESGNDEILREIQKPTTKRKLRIKRHLFRKYPEVFVSANFIIGFPKETFQQMLDSYVFACELDWDWSSFYICQPLKGTEMFSVFQALGDDRCEVENYDKTLNPGRAAARGEFGYRFHEGSGTIATGKEVFNLARHLVPNREQIKEIWFTFNLVANFINNYNFYPGGNPEKLVRWFESIAHAYPYDASMVAALARGYHLLGDRSRYDHHRRQFYRIVDNSVYWQRRIREFPELLDFVESPDRVQPYKPNLEAFEAQEPVYG
ncbi:MAG: radical SAM protein [Gemmataceae bacterium]|nr:radical SAM protein [Gemmataceae bacterium]